MYGAQERKQARKHADFMQKVPKLTVFFEECNTKQSSCEQREEQKNGKERTRKGGMVVVGK